MTRHSLPAILIAAAAAALLLCFPLGSQTLTGSFTGVVTDSSGAVIPMAGVTVKNADTSVTVWRGQTDATGVFRALALPAGRYDITIEAPGFQKFEFKAVPLTIAEQARIDATLRPGELAQSITVTAESASRLETESAVIGTTIDPTQIEDMPIAGRSVTNLLSLVAGVVNSGSGSSVSWWQMSINGTRTLNFEFTLDGMSVISGVTGNIGTLPAPDAIREFKVMTSGYSAEFGRTSGATVSSVIASGTSQYHGSLYEYLRNEAFNANGFFNNLRGIQRPRDRFHQFGGTFSGPIWLPGLYEGKEKTFFFYNVDKQLLRSPSTPNATVPDAAFRAGNFSASPIVVNDPVSGAPFPGNQIPQTRIDSAARKIMGLMPEPNNAGTIDAVVNRRLNNFVSTQVLSRGPLRHTGRLDHAIGADVRLFLSVNQFTNPQPSPYIIPGPLNNNIGRQDDNGYTANLGYTHIWKPNFITEARLGFTREFSGRNPDTLGINVADVFGIARYPAAAAPRLQISGWPEYGTNVNTYFRTINNTWQTTASATWVHSRHVVKFGVQLRKNQHNAFNPGGQWMGIYTFSGEMTSPTRVAGVATQGLADFLLGYVKTSTYDLPQPMSGRRNSNLGLFINDDWKVTRKLTINAGLRYEHESPVTVSNDIYSRLDAVSGKMLAALKNSTRDLDLPTPKLNLAPRLGLAYSLSNRTVLRTAAGFFYGQIFSNLGGITSYPGYQVTHAFPNLGVGVAQPFKLSEGFPLVAVQDLNDPFRAERNATVSAPLFSGASYGSVKPLPLTYQWNFGVQHNVGAGVIVEATYLGTRGLRLPLFLTMNIVPLERGEEVAFAGTTVAAQLARPFPTVGAFGSQFHVGDSIYHSLQLTASRQLARDISFRTSYTYSKTIDDGSGVFNYSQPNGIDSGQFPQLFRRIDRSLSSFDMPHNFVLALQYKSPGRKWVRGWEFNPIVIARSGLPDTINQSNLHPSVTQQRPSVISNRSLYLPELMAEGTSMRYLMPVTDSSFPLVPTGPLFTGTGAARRLVLPFSVGTLGRNTVRMPGQVAVDLSVGRRFAIREKVQFQVRAEAFNAFNKVNFGSASTALSVAANAAGQAFWNAPSFGLITSTRNARFMQLVGRFEF